MNTKNSNMWEKTKKYLPYGGLVLLTLFIMNHFRTNPDNANIFNQGKNALIGFYTEDLRPLFHKTNISNEDVFNFALYNNLPLDKEQNKALEVDDMEGAIKIKPAFFVEDTKNLEKFKKELNLDDPSNGIDSILNDYKDEIYSSVLYNDINTFAVNPDIIKIKDQIAEDIYDYVKNIKQPGAPKPPKSPKPAPFPSDKPSKNEFIIFARDTVFNRLIEINEELVKKEAEYAYLNAGKQEEISKKLAKANELVKVYAKAGSKYNYNFGGDSSTFKVTLSELANKVKPGKDLEDLIVLSQSVKKLPKNTVRDKKTGFSFDVDPQGFKINVVDEDADSLTTVNFRFNLKNLDGLIQKSISGALQNRSAEDWEKFGLQMDSLAKSFEKSFKDSLSQKGGNK